MDKTYFTGEEIIYKLKRLFAQVFIDAGLNLSPDRLLVRFQPDLEVKATACFKAMVNLATQEDEVHKYPADWWQWFKSRWFPRWALKRWPVSYAIVWAVHKYPEVAVPAEFTGSEFIHFKIVKDNKIYR